MEPQRIFCGWNKPALEQIVSFLCEQYGRENELDLSSCLLVFAGARAGRRLVERLALVAHERLLILTPPRTITVGAFAESVYLPEFPIATPLESSLAWMRALSKLDPYQVKLITGLLPEQDDYARWLTIARSISDLYTELSGELISFAQAGEKIAELPSSPDDQRWSILSGLHGQYLVELAEVGLIDREAARHRALKLNSICFNGTVVLCNLRDLNLLGRSIIDKLNCPIYSLIHAPESEARAFDKYGAVFVPAWLNYKLDIPTSKVVVALDPADQALAALAAINKLNGRYHQSEIVVGQTDQHLLPFIENVFEAAGLQLHDPSGQLLGQTRPMMLLTNLSKYLNRRRFSDFAVLARFPEVERLIRQNLPQKDLSYHPSILSALDQFQIEHLQAGTVSGPAQQGKLEHLVAQMIAVVDQIVEPFRKDRKSLEAWLEQIQKLVTTFYPDPNQFKPEFEALNDTWIAVGDTSSALIPHLNGAQALSLFIELAGQVAIARDRSSTEIESLGWLELQLEDAPALIICGLNEGYVPESVNSDSFLPETVRKHLGLLDNDRRYARDAFVLRSIEQSVPELTLIYARLDQKGTPLLPSRLLLSCTEENFASRVGKLYLDQPITRTLGSVEPRLGSNTAWRIPPPARKLKDPIAALSVTAFKDYLQSPYRFYLKHICKLSVADDSALEMDGALFGSLGHSVIFEFAKGNSFLGQDSDANEAELTRILDQVFVARFGIEPLPAVMIQREQLKRRLSLFAKWQSKWRADGWLTKEVEYKPSAKASTFMIDQQPFTIEGRIDRIDYHPTENVLAVIDYKFGEDVKEPKQAHFKSDKLVDLQLPLYYHLLRQDNFIEPIRLGYIRLSPGLELDQIGSIHEWTKDELDYGLELAFEVIRKIRRQEFDWVAERTSLRVDSFGPILGLSQFIEESGNDI